MRLSADRGPVLFADIIIDLDDPSIEPVAAAAFGAGNPKLLARIGIEVVGLESLPAKPLQRAAAVVDRLAGFRKAHAPDPARTLQAVGLLLYVHDAGRHRFSSL